MAAPKITSADHSAHAFSPRERLTKSRVGRGGASHVNETGNGIEPDPYDPEFEAQMAVAEDIMRENRDLLRKLAKSGVWFGSMRVTNASDDKQINELGGLRGLRGEGLPLAAL